MPWSISYDDDVIISFAVPTLEQEAAVDVAEAEAGLDDVLELLLDHFARDAVSDRDLGMDGLAVDRRVDVAVDELVDRGDGLKRSRGAEGVADHRFGGLDQREL